MESKKNIVFLYTELAEYFISCVAKASTNTRLNILVIHWPINKEAPFSFSFPENVQFIDKSKISRQVLFDTIVNFNPQTIISSGWIDKDYLKICSLYFHKCTTVLALDNSWNGSLKQKLLIFFSPLFLKKTFKKVWAPGTSQKKYAEKLSFKKENIFENFYAPDISFYQSFSQKNTIPHVFLYVGRYVKHKGIFELWNAFIELKKEYPNSWELYCVGTGEEFENKLEHEDIKHFGFIQPKNLGEILTNSGVYILPSTFEPWGVVVHEMAAAGFPLLLSDAVGSKEIFLSQDNGFEFKPASKDAIKEAMKKIIQTSDEDLLKMSQKSVEYSKKITQEMWVDTLVKL
ncbi:MAG: glycosyltransferase [Bacteroidia bacterium]